MSQVTVIIGTFGTPSWKQYGEIHAGPSARAQTVPCEVVHSHARSLAEARNTAAVAATTEWLCFLDADDELAPDYIEQMLAVEGDIRRPNTQGVHEDGTVEEPCMIPRREIHTANFIVIGALVRREMFLRVGGFDPELPVLEDWDLWLRCFQAGAEIVDVPDAVYRVHVHPGSRNLNQRLHRDTYQKIKRRYRTPRPSLELT